jgi:hypothetical protein
MLKQRLRPKRTKIQMAKSARLTICSIYVARDLNQLQRPVSKASTSSKPSSKRAKSATKVKKSKETIDEDEDEE